MVAPLSTTLVPGSPATERAPIGDAVAAGDLEHGRSRSRLRGGRAAEQGLQRLRRGDRRPAASARRRAGGVQREIGRHHQRLVAGDGELVGAAAAGTVRRRRSRQSEGGGRGGQAEMHDTHVRLSFFGALPSRISSARTSKSSTPMVIAASPTLKTKKGRQLAEMQIGIVDDIAEPHPIEDVAERAAEHEAERDRIVAPASRATARASDEDRRSRRSGRPAASAAASPSAVSKPSETPLFCTQSSLKNGEPVDRQPRLRQLERVGDHPLHRLVERRRPAKAMTEAERCGSGAGPPARLATGVVGRRRR